MALRSWEVKVASEECTPFGWPPEMEEAYRKWADERENPCLCLNCLQARLATAKRQANARIKSEEPSDDR